MLDAYARLASVIAAGTPEEEMDKALAPGNTYTALASHVPDGADDFNTYQADRGSFRLEL